MEVFQQIVCCMDPGCLTDSFGSARGPTTRFMLDIVGQKNIRQVWDELAQTHGEKAALIFEDREGRTWTFSYLEMNAEINRAANLFLSLGIAKGDRVVLHLHNSPEFLFCWFGLAKIGAVSVPVNAHYLEIECAFVVDKCQPKAVVVEECFKDRYLNRNDGWAAGIEHVLIARVDAERQLTDCLNFNGLLSGQEKTLQQIIKVDSEDVAEILYTSGTTSSPKGVVVTHYNLIFAGRYTAWQGSIRCDDRYLSMMPVWHIDLQCTAAMPSFVSGATFILLEKYSASRFWSQVCLHRATLTECIPLMVRTLLAQPRQSWEKQHCLRDIFYYLPMSEQEKDAFYQRFDVCFLTSYGTTETIVGLLGDRPGEERRWPSIGKPGFGYDIKIVDEEGREAAPNVLGDLYIKGIPGKTIFKEYYLDPTATNLVLDSDGWFCTGDKGRMDEDGYFYFVDRQSHLIKRAGENISSVEIENFLMTHPLIADAAVVGVPDCICDETVKAFVIVKPGESLGSDEIIAYCREHIAHFKVPSVVEIRSNFPRTSTGKVKKSLLREESLAQRAVLAITS